MSEDPVDAERLAAFEEFSSLLEGVNLSAPSGTKFRRANEWFARRAGVDPNRAITYYVSKPANFDVRFNQPGVFKHKPVLGVALIPEDVRDVSLYLTPAVRVLSRSSSFEAMILVGQLDGGPWKVRACARKPTTTFDPTAGNLIDKADVQEVRPIARGGELATLRVEGVYDIDRFCAETGIAVEVARDWLRRLFRKKQIVIQGPPGTGKTWVAERLARLVASETNGLVDTVQFHPSYTYEDFVAGLAPELSPEGTLTFRVAPGRFLDFCDEAAQAPEAKSVLVIDEINRADLSRVFGELMNMLEYRDEPLRLANAPGDGRFAVPSYVYIIATMNTADRSIALLDHALRRRFSFVRLEPDYNILAQRLEAEGLDPTPLVRLLTALNRDIGDPDFHVGISFFLPPGIDLKGELPSIWDGEVMPYVREFFHGRNDVIARYDWAAIKADYFAAWYGG